MRTIAQFSCFDSLNCTQSCSLTRQWRRTLPGVPLVMGSSSWWADNTSSAYPDWVQVDFSSSKTISEIDVFGVQQNSGSPVAPTLTMTSSYALTNFEVQYWTGSAWVGVPGASVSGNDKVRRQFSFAPLNTSKIRVYVTNVLTTIIVR